MTKSEDKDALIGISFHDLEVEESICLKFMHIANLMRDICLMKSEVRGLRNHPINDTWNGIHSQTGGLTITIFEKKYLAKEILDICNDFANTRNKKLREKVQHVRELTIEVLEGNYYYDKTHKDVLI